MLLLAQYTEENGISLGKIFDKVKVSAEDYSDIVEKLAKTSLGDVLDGDKLSVEKLSKAIGSSDSIILGYAQTLKDTSGNIDLTSASTEGMSEYLKKSGNMFGFAAIKATLFNAALNAGIMFAVSLAIQGIAKAFDKFNETVEESTEKVNNINSNISDLKSQLEELNNLEYKSDFDKQKITQLERELELQERILEIEQKRLYQNQIGTSFSDYFDSESLISQQQAEYNHYNKEGFDYLSRDYKSNISDLEKTENKIRALTNSLNNTDNEMERLDIQEAINEAEEKHSRLMKDQQEIADQLTVNMGKYLTNYQTAQEAVESGLLTGSDLEKAQEMAEYWNQMYLSSLGIVTNIQQANGTYDNTDDLLMRKFGNISSTDLLSLSDEDKRIALSFSPDNIIGFEELQKKIAETKKDIGQLNDTDIDLTASLSISQTVDQLNTQIKPAFDSLQSAWNDILTDDGFA